MAPSRSGEGQPPVPSSVLLYSHSWLPGQIDGVAVRMMAHAKSLREHGAKVTVVTPDFVRPGTNGEPPKLNEIPGVEHVVIQSQPTPVYQKNLCMKFSIKNYSALVGVIKRVRPDLVHGTQEASLQVLASACLACDVPLVVSMHTDVTQIAARDEGFAAMIGGSVGRLWARTAVVFTNLGYRNWARSGAKFFCVSPQSNKILSDAGVAANCVCPGTWGPMVDRQTFCLDLPAAEVAKVREGITFGIEDAFLMVYIGRVTAEKDIQFLVDALKRAPKRVVLALIGPGSMCAELKQLHGKENRLHCTGEIHPREKVALILRGADCCVSASTMETVGFTAMEALSCGTPCLMVNAQGFKLHLTHGRNARLWTPHSEESFDEELAMLMNQKREGCWTPEALRESMADASVEECTKRALKAYQSVSLVGNRFWHLLPAMFWLVVNWLLSFFIL